MWPFIGGWYSLVVLNFIVSISLIVIFERTSYKNKLYLINFIVVYILLVSSVSIYDIYLEYKLCGFDIDGDGFFSLQEQTREQQIVFKNVMADTGRSLVLVTAAIYSAVATGILFVLLLLRGRNQ